MQFVYPEFLYALFLLALPIIIHLFNFKRFKTLYFPDVSFLKEIKQKSQSTSRIKHLLVLLSRMLMITAMVFAFAQPFWKESGDIKQQGKRGVQIYLDNSFSMESQAEQGRLFDEARQRAYTIINSYSLSDRFQIISNSFETEANLWLNADAAIERIQNIDIDNRNRSLSEIIMRFNEADLDDIDQVDMYMISDFQRNNFDLNEVDSLKVDLNLVLLGANENDNISLQELQFEKPFHLPGQIEKLQAKLIRHGESDKLKIPIKLFLSGSLKVPLSMDFDREDTLTAELSFQSGSGEIQRGILAIKDYPITFDDSIYFNYSLERKINILHIFEKASNRYLSALFSEDSLYDYDQVDLNQINYTELQNSSLIILDELTSISSGTNAALSEYVRKGGDILFIPPSKAIEPSINTFLANLNTTQLLDLQEGEMKLGEINKDAFIFSGVFESIPKNIDLPQIDKYWLINESSNRIRQDLLSLKNGSSFLRNYKVDKGRLYLFSSPLSSEANNFCRHALFVPTLFNIALYSQEKKELYHYLESPLIRIENIDAIESPVHIVGNGLDLIPQQEYKNGGLNIRLNNSIKKAGHYDLVREENIIGSLSLNFGREESDYSLMNEEEIVAYSEEFGLKFNTYDQEAESLNQSIKNSKQGRPLWKYFIILALLFMAIEIALLRLFK